MLTTQTGTKIGETIVTDVNANIPSAPTPRAPLSPEAALLFDKGIVARPLMVPEVCSIRVKNTEYRYRWCNREGRGGMVYNQRRAQGFTNATSDDVEVLSGDTVSTNSEITAGDVILVKIRADLYDAAIKYNMQKAAVLQRSRGMYLQGASSDVMSDAPVNKVSVRQDAGDRTGLAPSFIPDNPEALINGGDAEAARKMSQGIRDNIAAEKKGR